MNALRTRLPTVALYFDKKVIVINKPHGIVSQATVTRDDGEHSEDALDPILDHLKVKLELSSRPLPVHRLDKSTTGALLLARTPQISRDLSQQFKARSVSKTYLALVRAGRQSFATETGTIDAKLKITDDGRVSVSSEGKKARTDWELVDSSLSTPLSLLKLTLHTGLKHQLRVHLAHVLNAPILGDTTYSRSEVSEKIRTAISLPANRLFLHASHISFFRYHSWGQAKRYRLGITAPLPKDFVELCIQAGLTLDARSIHGHVTVDDQPATQDLSNIGGKWMGPKSP